MTNHDEELLNGLDPRYLASAIANTLLQGRVVVETLVNIGQKQVKTNAGINEHYQNVMGNENTPGLYRSIAQRFSALSAEETVEAEDIANNIRQNNYVGAIFDLYASLKIMELAIGRTKNPISECDNFLEKINLLKENIVLITQALTTLNLKLDITENSENRQHYRSRVAASAAHIISEPPGNKLVKEMLTAHTDAYAEIKKMFQPQENLDQAKNLKNLSELNSPKPVSELSRNEALGTAIVYLNAQGKQLVQDYHLIHGRKIAEAGRLFQDYETKIKDIGKKILSEGMAQCDKDDMRPVLTVLGSLAGLCQLVKSDDFKNFKRDAQEIEGIKQRANKLHDYSLRLIPNFVEHWRDTHPSEPPIRHELLPTATFGKSMSYLKSPQVNTADAEFDNGYRHALGKLGKLIVLIESQRSAPSGTYAFMDLV